MAEDSNQSEGESSDSRSVTYNLEFENSIVSKAYSGGEISFLLFNHNIVRRLQAYSCMYSSGVALWQRIGHLVMIIDSCKLV